MLRKSIIFALALSAFSMADAQQPWSLKQCIDYALEHNISIRLQENTVESSKVALNTSKSSRLPNLTASADQSLNFGRGLTADNTYANRNTTSTGFGMSTNVPLYTGGQLTHDINMKQLNLQAALVDLNKAKEDISLQVTSAYLDVLYQKELLQVSREQLELSKIQENRLKAMLENGKVAETEVIEAHATVASDELNVTQNENNVQLALLTLSPFAASTR